MVLFFALLFTEHNIIFFIKFKLLKLHNIAMRKIL